MSEVILMPSRRAFSILKILTLLASNRKELAIKLICFQLSMAMHASSEFSMAMDHSQNKPAGSHQAQSCSTSVKARSSNQKSYKRLHRWISNMK